MDIFSTTVTVVNEIYTITLFIRDVVIEVKSYKDNVQDIQIKLEHEFVFLETFKSLFFDKDDAFTQYSNLPTNLKQNVTNILVSLKKTLAEYGIVALRHGFKISEPQSLLATPSSPPTSNATQSTTTQSGLRSRLKGNWQALRQKFDPLDWALFDKEKILKLLREYGEWTERLRQVMTLMLLVIGSIGGSTRTDLAQNAVGAALGLREAAERQIRAVTQPPDDFPPLEGTLSAFDGFEPGSVYRSAKYIDASGFETMDVIVEQHVLDMPSTYAKEQVIRKARRPIEHLAWLLQGGQANRDELRNTSLHSLPCLGYILRPSTYPILVYQAPQSHVDPPRFTALHDFIDGKIADGTPLPLKPALGQRFALAHALASTLFQVHSSGWVHKSISSRNILIFSEKSTTSNLVPYLMGWTVARPSENKYRMRSKNLNNDGPALELEPNIYRHPERYGSPAQNYENKHDIYALGVVLLEIGLWTTMSTQFTNPIAVTRAKKSLPPVKLVQQQLLSLSRAKELEQEMGEMYSKTVQRCLTTDFEVGAEDEMNTVLTSKFRSLVVEQLNRGTAL